MSLVDTLILGGVFLSYLIIGAVFEYNYRKERKEVMKNSSIV